MSIAKTNIFWKKFRTEEPWEGGILIGWIIQIIKTYTTLAMGKIAQQCTIFQFLEHYVMKWLPLLSYVFETRVLNSMNVLLVVILIFSCWIFYDLISSFIQRMEFSENMWGIYIENCRKMERVILCRNLFHSTKLFGHTSLICID